MRLDAPVTFGPFRLDAANERLWQGSQVVALRPKPFAVLKHLVEHHGQLVTKQQLLDAVWPSTFVGDAVLKDSIRQLREALDDDAVSPRYIETAHRRGYRFIGELVEAAALERKPPAIDLPPGSPVADEVHGRDAELAKMRQSLARALRGERQVVFVTGEAGIGKTTVVNALLAAAAGLDTVRIARGQCLEHYGAGEAYLPVLDGFSRLGRGPGGLRVIEVLRQHAPAWLRELPSLIPASERSSLQQQVMGATRERMLREMGEAIEALTAEAPLVLLLEDLHWSDYSTIDLVAYLARRRDPARLMVIGTYRPVDVILNEHPLKGLKRELQAHGLCLEVPLEYLPEEAIVQYLAARFPGHQFPNRLARLIHRRTEGNPLFMVNVIQHLLEDESLVEAQGSWQLRGGLERVESRVPENVRQLIEKQIERLSPDERRALEGASVVGMDCSSTAIAAGLDRPAEWVDQHCEALVRRHQFLIPARLVTLPDGTVTPRYKFSHVLYLEVPYSLIAPMARARIHGRIGERGEAIYGVRAGEIAAELAMHFEQGRDACRAVKYLLLAAENATHRSAHHEAAALARRGLLALETLTPDPEASNLRTEQELSLRVILGVSLMATKGFAVAEVESVFGRALELCSAQAPSTRGFVVEWLLGLFHYFRGELEPARAIAARLLDTATALGDPVSIMEAHRASGVCLVDLGRFSEGVDHLDRVAALYGTQPHPLRAAFAGQDPKVVSECFAARALWALGYPDQARDRIDGAIALAGELAQSPSLVLAAYFAAVIHQLRGEPLLAQERAETVIAIADEYGLEMWTTLGRIHRGWARLEQGAADDPMRELERGLTAYQATGGRLWRGHALGLLAAALARAGRIEEGLAAVAEALVLVHELGEQCPAAELHRMQGELLLMQASGVSTSALSGVPARFDKDALPLVAHAEACFERALALARVQQARSWELRVATSLGHLLHRQGKREKARRIVKGVHDWFAEGLETADLKAARAALSGF